MRIRTKSETVRKVANPLQLAIVGCGAISERGHIPAIKKVPEVNLAALVDTNLARAVKLAEENGISYAGSNLIEVYKGLDAIILATPPDVRPNIAEQAFTLGLHVLCEKPLANTSLECKSILSSAKRAERVLAVAHNYRYHPNRIHVYDLLQQKFLDTIHTVIVEEGSPSDWPTITGYSFRREEVPGGVLLNGGVHSLDTLFWWFGYPLDFKYVDDAIGGLESNVKIKMNFAQGITGTFRLSRTCLLNNQIVINGTKGQITIPIYDPIRININVNGKAVKQKLGSQTMGFIDVLAEQLRDFAKSITNKCQPRVTGLDGARVIEFIERCYAVKHARPFPPHAPIPGMTW